jgi:hypothetical protein
MPGPPEISYYALRRCPAANAPVWWAAVRRRPDAPAAIAALLGDRHRVELGSGEATAALAWAEAVDGWPPAGLKPVVVYPRDPRSAP